MSGVKSGTTTLGLIFKDGIILAADKQTSFGHMVYDDETLKLNKITDYVALANAGSVGDIQAIVRFLKSQATIYELERNTPMTPKAMVNLLSNVFIGNRYFPYSVQFIVGGFVGKPQLYEIEGYGAIIERKKYSVNGSGTTFAMTVLDNEYKENMSQKEAFNLAVKAVLASKKRDIYSGGLGVSVMIITKDGLIEKNLDEKEVASIFG